MEKQFVTYEIAVKLKEFGFNEPCIMHWFIGDANEYSAMGDKKELMLKNLVNEKGIMSGIEPSRVEFNTCAPMWQQVIDWLREKHRINLKFEPTIKNEYEAFAQQGFGWIFIFKGQYNEAREIAILKSLELIKK